MAKALSGLGHSQWQSWVHIKVTDLMLLAPAFQEMSQWAMWNTIPMRYLQGKSSGVT